MFTAAIAAVNPHQLVASYLSQRVDHGHARARRWLVVGAGKAAARMAAGCEEALGVDAVRGLVLTADGCRAPLRRIECAEAGHPTPDERGHRATARLIDQVADSADPVIALISGGASALLVHPVPPITLEEKVVVNRLLLRCNASIDEVNCVRKHLSLVKGGGLLRRCGERPLVTLILSDVVGDDPTVIGSGPTVPDPTTFADAVDVLRRHGLETKVSPAVRDRLIRGARGEIEVPTTPGIRLLQQRETVILGNNGTALKGAAAAAGALGYRALVMSTPLVGETTQAARAWLREVQQLTRDLGSTPWCVLAGGETTVEVRGQGRGGRNQEFALALVDAVADHPVTILSAGSDGIDGPTDAAGAFVDGATATRARARNLHAAHLQEQNDSYRYFAALDDLFLPGPTGTNVTDIKIAIGGLG